MVKEKIVIFFNMYYNYNGKFFGEKINVDANWIQETNFIFFLIIFSCSSIH